MFLHFKINYMKYLTLFLLFIVFLYGIQNTINTKNALATSSFYTNEIPIYSVNTDQPVLALTFDSAWGSEDIDSILSILEKHNAPATFFVTGEWASRYPTAIQSIDRAGHDLGNHGNSHKHMPQISKQEMASEIQTCHNIVYDIIQKDMSLFRAPYSDWNRDVVDVAHMLGYSAINHSIDSLDWKDYGCERLIRTVCEHKNLENGSIILLHTGTKYTGKSLDIMLTNLEEQGYRFTRLSSLIYKSNYYLDHTGKQYSKTEKKFSSKN